MGILHLNAEAKFYIFIRKLISPQGKLYQFYSQKLLLYTEFTVEKLIFLKILIFVLIFLLALLIKYTNIDLKTKEILTRLDYGTHYMKRTISADDAAKALEQEISCFRLALGGIGWGQIKHKPAAEILQQINAIIPYKDAELLQDRSAMAGKLYQRLYDYYEARDLYILLYMSMAVAASFVPDLVFYIRGAVQKARALKELRFLKRLIIMNGSIKPVDFREILSLLIDKSFYYKKLLKDIEDNNKRNSTSMPSVYSDYIKSTRDINLKLFFEKLDQANNYDFDQAVKNIENEFKVELREDVRRVRKRIELIHAIGVMGFMIIIFIMTLYLIEPWLQMYDVSRMGF